MRFFEVIKDVSARVKSPLSYIVRFILILAILNSAYFKQWHLLFVNILLLGLILFPLLMKKGYKIHIPGEFEFIILLFILSSFFLGEFRGLVIQIFLGASISFVGFMLMFILFTNNKIQTNYFLMAIFSFSFAVTIGATMEVIKYFIKTFYHFEFNVSSYLFTIQSLALISFGALIVSVLGFVFMKYQRVRAIGYFMQKFIRRNPRLFVRKTDSPEELIKLIKAGEGRDLEFKSTLRTNLFTKEIDKKIELSVMKTLVAFLNSHGGTLLIGVTDDGKIAGIEKDNFENNDRFNLHFANLIKQHIGKKFLPFLSFELIQIEERHVMKIECLQSNKPVFLKAEGREELFIRSGSASTLISGSELLEYIEHRFKRE